ncbi:unnamed protein product [Allacma fusca]|uniref:Uncharacterized protein n=1 Tax=Allacma fusca TaxID=39272 RepID=A0A8J2JC52_9HEXA|nr:unnamed protein product [Allacma fusca]
MSSWHQHPTHHRYIGRCKRFVGDWKAGSDIRYECYKDLAERLGTGYVPHVPEFPPGAGNCKNCEEARNNTRTNGISANSEVGHMIWSYRTTHGMAMVLTTILVLPFGTLTSRYYKETVMKTRFVNVHLCSFLAYCLALCPSPMRAFTKGARVNTIFLHFLFGTIARILLLFCLLTSFYIPGSPSAMNDIHMAGFTFEFYAFIVIVWLIGDVAVNVILAIFVMGTDNRGPYSKRRTYVMVVPIPLIRPYDEEDLADASMRKILLLAHILICLFSSFFLASIICVSSPEGRWFGHMWYTHKASGKLNMLMRDVFYA